MTGQAWRSGRLQRWALDVARSPQKRLRVGGPLLLFAGGMGALALSHTETVPYSNRLHVVWISRDDEAQMSREARTAVLEQEGKAELGPSHETTKMVQRVADQILEGVRREGRLGSALGQHMNFEVHVIDKPIPNAFVLPSGAIFVYTGVLPLAKTEGGLACILGHEVSHALARHSAEKISKVRNLMLAYEFVRGFLQGSSDHYGYSLGKGLFEFLAVTVLQVGLPLSHSRMMEREADRIGLIIAAEAGYDPREASLLWKRMSELAEGGTSQGKGSNPAPGQTAAARLAVNGPPSATTGSPASLPAGASPLSAKARLAELFSTHPSSERRMRDLEKEAQGLMTTYYAARDRIVMAGARPPESGRLLFPKKGMYPDDSSAEQFESEVFKGAEGEVWESMRLAQNAAALMVGPHWDRIMEFLKEMGRDKVVMFEEDT